MPTPLIPSFEKIMERFEQHLQLFCRQAAKAYDEEYFVGLYAFTARIQVGLILQNIEDKEGIELIWSWIREDESAMNFIYSINSRILADVISYEPESRNSVEAVKELARMLAKMLGFPRDCRGTYTVVDEEYHLRGFDSSTWTEIITANQWLISVILLQHIEIPAYATLLDKKPAPAQKTS